MPDNTPLELRYSGRDVADGTVPVNDMVDALVGFSSAYGKIARRYQTLETGHRIRVVGLEKGSAKILLDVVEWASKNPAVAVPAAGLIGKGAYTILKDLAGVIRGKKALEGKPLTDNSYTFINNGVILQGVPLSKAQFEYIKSGELDPDLDKLTAPLEEGNGVDEFELKSGEEELVKVTKNERPYFRHVEVEVTTTKDDIWLQGTFNSHSKTNNRGMFHTAFGKHIPYHYVGQNVNPLLLAYAYNGLVRVYGKVKFNANLDPISVEIRDVEIWQQNIFDLDDERNPER